jgi:hypothetical protein
VKTKWILIFHNHNLQLVLYCGLVFLKTEEGTSVVGKYFSVTYHEVAIQKEITLPKGIKLIK